VTAPAAAELRRVRLLRMPVQVWVESKQHMDELLREFTMLSAGEADGSATHHTPRRLLALVDALKQQYGAGSEERDAAIFAAADAGETSLDVDLDLPVAAVGAATQLGDMLEEVDEYCRQGRHLLTLATPPELVRFRRWYLGEVAAQLQGGEPTPWGDDA
jgi:hypothetical protein